MLVHFSTGVPTCELNSGGGGGDAADTRLAFFDNSGISSLAPRVLKLFGFTPQPLRVLFYILQYCCLAL